MTLLCITWRPQLSHFLSICLYLLCLPITAQSHFDEDQFSCIPDNPKYDWERLNYYEILGLPESSLDSKAIRKAYRQQAQSWHPDKVAHNRTNIDEVNSRFAQIAQAYEVLKDPETKASYDRFLRGCAYQERQQQRYNNEHYHTQRNNYHNYHSTSSSYSASSSSGHHQSPRYGPTSVRKEQERLMDPMTGAPILRETIYEEYARDNYYKISIQDFLVESMDAWGNAYFQPMYPSPRLVEEGPLHHSHHYPYQQEQQQQHYQQNYSPPSTNNLDEGDVLRSHEMLLSDNQRYRAHIDNCRLVIEARTFPEDDDGNDDIDGQFEVEVVWQSNNDVPFMGSGGENECFLALEKGQLMIATGTPEFHTGSILWFSAPDTSEDDNSFMYSHRHNFYQARLENDGKLIVYRVDDDLEAGEPRCIWGNGPFRCNRVVSQAMHLLRVTKDKLRNHNANDGNSQDSYYHEEDVINNILTTISRRFREIFIRNKETHQESHDDEEEGFISSLLDGVSGIFNWRSTDDEDEEAQDDGYFASQWNKVKEMMNWDAQDEQEEEDGSIFAGLFRTVEWIINGDVPPVEKELDGAISQLGRKARQALRKFNRIRRGIEDYFEARTIIFVRNAMLKWQKYQARRRFDKTAY